MRMLCIFTNTFPFGTGEEFIQEELLHLQGFDEVIIYPLGVWQSDIEPRPVPAGVRVSTSSRRWVTICTRFVSVFSRREIVDEARGILRERKYRSQRLRALAVFMRNVWREFDVLSWVVRDVAASEADAVVLYGYWFHREAYFALLARERIVAGGVTRAHAVSRAHRFDLYEEVSGTEYLPFRHYMLDRLDAVFPCSSHGAGYLRKRYPDFAGKITPAFLGVAGSDEWRSRVQGESSDARPAPVVQEDDASIGLTPARPFHVVSCSSLIPVKRVSLLAEAIGLLTFPVLWTHLGSGPEEVEVRRVIATFPENATADLRGHVQNDEVRRLYGESFVDVFVNVSSSEGIPVSIMEALAAGVPIVATDAGGSGEAVQPYINGYLLPVEVSARAIAELIESIHNLEPEEYADLREGARGMWASRFDARSNYQEFFDILASLDQT